MRRTIRAERKGLIIGVTAGVIWTLSKVALPFMARLGVDHGIVDNQPGELQKWTIGILIVALVSALCTGIRRYVAFGIAYRAETDLRLRLFAHLQRLHFAYHDHAQTGQLMSRAASDLQQIQGFVVMIPITVSNALTVMLRGGGPCSSTGSSRCSRSLPLPALNVMANRFSARIHPVSMELQQELAGVSTSVEETVTGIRVVKGFGAEKVQTDKLHDHADRVLDRALYAGRVRAGFMPLLDFIPALGILAVFGTAATKCLTASSPSATSSASCSTSTC